MRTPNGKQDCGCSVDNKGHEECLWAESHFEVAAHISFNGPPGG